MRADGGALLKFVSNPEPYVAGYLSIYLSIYALIGPHPLHKKQILYGYPTLDTTPQQLANYLLALAKTTIYKTYLATNNTHTKPPDYQRMLRVRLLFRLNLEMHYSTWKDDVEKFKSYWLHKTYWDDSKKEGFYSPNRSRHCYKQYALL
jgi:hypothetical protein